MPRALPWLLPALSLLGLCAGLCMLSRTDYADALGTSTASVGSNTFNTSRIFPGDRTFSTLDLRDASSGAESNQSDALSFADAIVSTTGNWTTAFASTRYLQFDFNSPLAAGLSVSAATFDFRMIPNASSETACYYFEVRRISTDAVLNTYGSSGAPVACITGATYNTTSTSIVADVSTTDIANDLRIRVYGKESSSHQMKVDMATVTVTTAYSTSTLYRKVYTDASTGTGTTTTWPLTAAGDSATYTAAANWPNPESSTKYLKVTFPAYVPTGAGISSVTLNNTWGGKVTGSTWSMFFEVYDGATLLASHGSTSSPASTRTGTALSTDTISLTEVNSVAHANNIVIKFYIWTSAGGSAQTVHDQISLTINYRLN